MTGVFKRRETGTQRQTQIEGKQHAGTQAEDGHGPGVMHLPDKNAKDCWQTPEARSHQEGFSPRAV